VLAVVLLGLAYLRLRRLMDRWPKFDPRALAGVEAPE